MDIFVGGHTTVRDLHGQQGDLRQRLLRRDVATRDIQKGKVVESCFRQYYRYSISNGIGHI